MTICKQCGAEYTSKSGGWAGLCENCIGKLDKTRFYCNGCGHEWSDIQLRTCPNCGTNFQGLPIQEEYFGNKSVPVVIEPGKVYREPVTLADKVRRKLGLE